MLRLYSVRSVPIPWTTRKWPYGHEKELLSEGYRFGELYPHREALKMKPSWAIARQWAAGAEGRDHLREENQRLQRLLYDAIRVLKDAGEERKTARIEQAMNGR